jgi:hypothetical protein
VGPEVREAQGPCGGLEAVDTPVSPHVLSIAVHLSVFEPVGEVFCQLIVCQREYSVG